MRNDEYTPPQDLSEPPPPALSAWLQERGFDACPWHRAPAAMVKRVPGRDAYRFGGLLLYRAPVPGTAGDAGRPTRFYAAVHLIPGPSPRAQGKAVGYWFAAPAAKAR